MNNPATIENQVDWVDNPNSNDVSNTPATVENKNGTVTKEPSAIFTLFRKYASVSDALRLTGALAVAFAMGIFLLEGVKVTNDLYRFITMLGLTSVLTAAGLIMSRILKEQRGSRVFIGLGLLSVPVNFTVFGALMYSVIPLDTAQASYPAFAHWQVAGFGDIPLAVVSGIAVLLPVIWLGFTVLARSARSWLSTALVISSLFLIIPLRGELWSSVIALASAATAWWFIRTKSDGSLVLKTLEGRFASAMLYIAPVIIAVRSLFLYEANTILLLAMCVGLYAFTRQSLASNVQKNFITGSLTIVGAIVAVGISLLSGDIINHFFSRDWTTIAGTAILLGLVFDLQKVAPRRALSSFVTGVLILVAVGILVSLSTVLSTHTALAGLFSVLMIIGVTIYGYLYKHQATAVTGALGTAAVVTMNAESAWQSIVHTGWWGVAAVGIAAITAGSMLDKAGTKVKVAD